MKYSILLFAGLREKLNCSKLEVDLEEAGITSDSLKQHLIHLYPEAESLISTCYLAKNLVYARPDIMLLPTDEIALIPPVSGG